MKKLLVLAVVLGVVSMASAGLTFNITDLNNITVEDIAGGTESSALYMTTTDDLVIDFSAGMSILSVPVMDFGFAQFADALTPGFPPASFNAGDIVISGLSYVSGAGDIQLYLSDGDVFAGAPPAASVTVPEPMTMALLGLGGLFLRRRK